MKALLIAACIIPAVALAQTGYDQPQQQQQKHYMDPVVPMIPALPPQGFAVYERERPLPPQWGVDSYKSYKVVPLDRYGQPTQPLITMDEVLTDLVWGSLHKNKD